MGRLNAPEPLTAHHHAKEFDCGARSLNEWLKHRALKNEQSGGSRTYVVCDGMQIIAYYAIATGSVARREAPGCVKKNMPDPIPALVLGRLAVDCSWQGQGIGQGLLKDALARSMNVSEQVGARVLIVHVMDDNAKAFYLKHGFTINPPVSNTLMLQLTSGAAQPTLPNRGKRGSV